jgi:hypothetical protein
MNEALTLTLWNSILPLVGLCALVALLPGWFAGRECLSQRVLAWAVVKTALVTLVVGAGLAAALYAAINDGVVAGIVAAPLERGGFFLGRSALFVMLWGPVLAFVWLVKAQEINRRIGLRMVDEGGKG